MFKSLSVAFFATLLFCPSVYADTNDLGVTINWSYVGNHGPNQWAQLDPGFAVCASGRSQSPINIAKNIKAGDYSLKINYKAAPLEIVKNGETTLVIANTQTIINDGHGVQVNFPAKNPTESIKWNDITYRLIQFHIHAPSEHQMRGRSYPMEIHFVHQGELGELAFIGVLVNAGEENETLEQIIQHLPEEQGQAVKIADEQINPLALLPKNMDYYSYMGSLTTPPCTEGVRWLLMSQAITASPAQIVQLRKAANGANARPVQPLYGRVISYTTTNKERE